MRAEERGYDADALAQGVPRFGQEVLFGSSNPVVFVLKICDRLDNETPESTKHEPAPHPVGKAKVFKGQHACSSCGLDLWWSDGGVGVSCFGCDPPQWSEALMAEGQRLADAAHHRREERKSRRQAENVAYEKQLEGDAIAAGLKPAAQALPDWFEAELAGSLSRYAAPAAVLKFPAAAAGAGP